MRKNEIVVKANQLVEAKYKLRLEEQRLILYLISQIEPGDKELKEYVINVSDFCKCTGLRKDNVYKTFVEMSKSLIAKTIIIDDDEATSVLSWAAQTRYYKGKGTITLIFAPALKPYLLELKKNFTSYALENVLSLKSTYSIRIYELLKQYEKIGERKFKVSTLKSILKVEKMYASYGDFKKRTIQAAQKELKEKCDICFEIEEIKKGRSVEEIKFLICKNMDFVRNKEPLFEDSQVTVNEYADRLSELDFIRDPLSEKELTNILEAASGDIDLVRRRYEIVRRKPKLNNMVGFMIWAVKQPDEQFEAIERRGKSKFNNFEGRDNDYDEIERLEREYLNELLGEAAG